jgi:hypothetical protein
MVTGSNNNSAILLTGAALLAASLGCLGYMSTLSSASSSKNSEHITEIDDDDNPVNNNNSTEIITEQDVCQVFDKFFLVLQQTFGNLMQQVQQLQMTGQMIPEEQLQGLVRQELERALLAKQASIIEAAGMDPDCLEEAVWEFLEQGNSKVKTAVERLQKIWQNATGEPVVGWRPPGKGGVAGGTMAPEELLTAERTIEVAGVYFSALTECMKDLVGHYKSEGKDLRHPTVQQQLNMDFAREANDAGEDALEQIGVSQNQFEASVKSHADNANVGRALGMLQMKQQQDLMALQAS